MDLFQNDDDGYRAWNRREPERLRDQHHKSARPVIPEAARRFLPHHQRRTNQWVYMDRTLCEGVFTEKAGIGGVGKRFFRRGTGPMRGVLPLSCRRVSPASPSRSWCHSQGPPTA